LFIKSTCKKLAKKSGKEGKGFAKRGMSIMGKFLLKFRYLWGIKEFDKMI
jgi:hypothetical protein